MGVSYEWSKIIPFILSLLSVGIFLKKSPFNAFINFMIVFGTTLVRSYSLCLLLMVLLIVIYKSRLKHSIIYGLLLFSIANTHVLLGGFVCGLILIDIWDCIHMKNRDSKKKLLISILTGVIGVFLLILQLYGGATARGFGTSFSFISLMREILEVIFKIVSFQVVKEEFVLFPIVGLIMFLMWGVCNKEFKIIFMVVCGLFFQLLVFIFVYPPNFYMGILFYLIILFGVYQVYSEKNKFRMFLISFLIFLPSVYGAYYYVLNDIKYDFSDSKDVANFIKYNIDNNSEIYCLSTPHCSSIIAYLFENDYRFINLNTLKEFTYENWKVKFSSLTTPEVIEEISRRKVRYYIKLKVYEDRIIDEKIVNGKAKIIYSSNDSKFMLHTHEAFDIIEFIY